MRIRGAETTGTEGGEMIIEIGTAAATATTIVEMTGVVAGVTTIVGTTAGTTAAAAAAAAGGTMIAGMIVGTTGAEAEVEGAGATIGAAAGDSTTAGTAPQPAPPWPKCPVACPVLSRAECGPVHPKAMMMMCADLWHCARRRVCPRCHLQSWGEEAA